MSKILGYARVSTNEQNVKLQVDALLVAGCEKENIFNDKVSGSKKDRPGLDKCLACFEEGDILLVWRIDRLGRGQCHI